MSKYASPFGQKKEKTKTYNYTQEMIDQINHDATKHGIGIGIYVCNVMYSAAMMMVLRDTLGFGLKRLNRIFTRVQKLFEEIMCKEIQYTDLLQTLRDECGVNLVVERPDNIREDALELFNDLERIAKVQMVVKKHV